MKRRDLIKKLEAAGAVYDHEGAEHTIYKLKGINIPVPRHREINELTAQGMIKKANKLAEEEK